MGRGETGVSWPETGLDRRRRPFQGLNNLYLQLLTGLRGPPKYGVIRVRRANHGWRFSDACGRFQHEFWHVTGNCAPLYGSIHDQWRECESDLQCSGGSQYSRIGSGAPAGVLSHVRNAVRFPASPAQSNTGAGVRSSTFQLTILAANWRPRMGSEVSAGIRTVIRIEPC